MRYSPVSEIRVKSLSKILMRNPRKSEKRELLVLLLRHSLVSDIRVKSLTFVFNQGLGIGEYSGSQTVS